MTQPEASLKPCQCGSELKSRGELRHKLCLLCQKEKRRKFALENPWVYNRRCAKNRCENKNYSGYESYGGRGIRFNLSSEETKVLWERDGASGMKHPSIDRVDNDGDYVFSNCRFIERAENARRAAIKKLSEADVLEIRNTYRFGSGVEMAKKYGIVRSTLYYALHGKSWAHLSTHPASGGNLSAEGCARCLDSSPCSLHPGNI